MAKFDLLPTCKKHGCTMKAP